MSIPEETASPGDTGFPNDTAPPDTDEEANMTTLYPGDDAPCSTGNDSVRSDITLINAKSFPVDILASPDNCSRILIATLDSQEEITMAGAEDSAWIVRSVPENLDIFAIIIGNLNTTLVIE